jgi:hypothetical protein
MIVKNGSIEYPVSTLSRSVNSIQVDFFDTICHFLTFSSTFRQVFMLDETKKKGAAFAAPFLLAHTLPQVLAENLR